MANSVIEVVAEIRGSVEGISASSSLVGENAILDSLDLVDLCLRLEDLARTMGFDFDWASEDAMSQSRSIFRSIESLQAYFDSQKPGSE